LLIENSLILDKVYIFIAGEKFCQFTNSEKNFSSFLYKNPSYKIASQVTIGNFFANEKSIFSENDSISFCLSCVCNNHFF